MSRIGKKPINLPAGVKVKVLPGEVVVEGKNGKLSFPLFPDISVRIEGDTLLVENKAKGTKAFRRAAPFHGLVRAHVANMVKGVSELWEKKLSIQGVGYNAKVQGGKLVLQIGFCHPVEIPIAKSLQVECPAPTEIVVRGIDRHEVGQFAANVRRVRPPEPYKGKGIRYADEVVRLKPGKSLTSGG